MDERLAALRAQHSLTDDVTRAIQELLSRGADPTLETRPNVDLAGETLSPEDLDAWAERVPPNKSSFERRYQDLGRIGRGASGDVRRVYDRKMDRVLAMKLLQLSYLHRPTTVTRFVNEATLTAGLQHPGIVVVHDRGLKENGQPWYTMKEVRGETLEQVIDSAHLRPDAGIAEILRPLVTLIQRICQAVAYAHDRGVIHRDLKPANLMVGEFGVVQVMDWGLGRNLNKADLPADTPLPGGATDLTHAGAILGTPAYMAPEMAAGRSRGTRAGDVYSLGAVLYRALACVPPYVNAGPRPWEVVAEHAPPRVQSHGRQTLPLGLVEACEHAMDRVAAARPTALELSEMLQDWLDGARARQRAELMVRHAQQTLKPKIADERQAAERLERQAWSALNKIPTLASSSEKEPAWALEEQAQAHAHAAVLAEARFEQALHAALSVDPTLDKAHDALSDLYRDRLIQAESRGDAALALSSQIQLETHDRGRNQAWLKGTGTLSLHTVPSGAQVRLRTFVQRGRRLVEGPPRLLGATPLDQIEVPKGSHLLEVSYPGFQTLRYPVRIARQEHWDGVRPGAEAPHALPLLPSDHPPGACYVPAGWFQCGGDAGAVDGLDTQWIWVDGFEMRTHPVTHGAYLAFVNAQLKEGLGAEQLAALVPVVSQANATDRPLYQRVGDGPYQAAPDFYGAAWDPELPITQITWHAAMAYAAWIGEGWRLPHELEWEKAARGVDGRTWPWGEHFEPTWANTVRATAGPPKRVPVDRYPTDCSPYGVQGLVGNVRDLCLNAWQKERRVRGVVLEPRPWTAEDAYVSVRGGNWMSTPAFCRPANRLVTQSKARSSSAGFRLVRPLLDHLGQEHRL